MEKSSAKPTKSKRLLALDIMRGITIAGMILVNNPGEWSNIYAPLRHAQWNGLTPTDLVFPFFMFIMGISTYFSLRKYEFKISLASILKILRRTVVIFAIGLFLAWFGLFLGGILSDKTFLEAVANFDRIRILGVMPRLALCYGLGASLALLIPGKRLWWFVGSLLVLYSLILIFGNGYEFSDANVIAIVDNKVLGPDHMYTDHIGDVRLKFDPEGLLSTLPSIAHVLIGFICGGLICATKDNELRMNRLFIVGTILAFSGFLLDYGLPINKKIWSPTFVLTTCGLGSLLLGLLIWIIDVKGYKKWCTFFEAFGRNPLFIYCFSTFLAIIIGRVRVPVAEGTASLKNVFYDNVIQPLCFGNACLSSVLFAICFVLLNWLIGYYLYKKNIIITI